MSLKKLEMLGPEPISQEMAKVYLRLDHDRDDGLLEGFISAARSAIEAYTSRSLIRQKWEMTLNAGYAVSRSDTTYLTGDKSRGDQGIELPRSPFVELTQNPCLVTDYGTKELKDFRLDRSGRTAHIHFGPSAQALFHGAGTIHIEFVAGYDPTELPESLRQAVLMVVAQLYENRVAANDNPGLVGEFQQGVLSLIKPYQVKRLA